MSEAQRRAKSKYLREKVDTIALRVPAGEKEIIRTHAMNLGESMNSFIIRAIAEAMQSDIEQRP